MLKLSFKDRISFYYMAGISILTLLIFGSIYLTVSQSVNSDIDAEIQEELANHSKDVSLQQGKIVLTYEKEWKEEVHSSALRNPVFVQVYGTDLRAVEKSPNMGNRDLALHLPFQEGAHYDTMLDGIPVRQMQGTLTSGGKPYAYLVVAMSVAPQQRVLQNLKFNLFITYPIFLVVLFFLVRLIAKVSLHRAIGIIDETRRITHNNITQRLPLPAYKDELHTLSATINGLLERIENGIRREKQFTTDASHELRTPLSIIRGTLEILLRKERSPEEYHLKINSCIEEVDRMSEVVEQLLLLARFENFGETFRIRQIDLRPLVQDALYRQRPAMMARELQVIFDPGPPANVLSDPALLSIIIDNVLSNGIKYGRGKIHISMASGTSETMLCISDNGIGISDDDLGRIYDEFYRSDSSISMPGIGLGLSIVRRITTLLGIGMQVNSQKGSGTEVRLYFTHTDESDKN
jgi:signal transduction histidine kinase